MLHLSGTCYGLSKQNGALHTNITLAIAAGDGDLDTKTNILKAFSQSLYLRAARSKYNDYTPFVLFFGATGVFVWSIMVLSSFIVFVAAVVMIVKIVCKLRNKNNN